MSADTRTNLIVPRSEALKAVAEQLAKADELLKGPITNEQQLEDARAEYYTWHDYVHELITRMFNNNVEAERLISSGGVYSMNPSLGEEIEDYRHDVKKLKRKLESLQQRLSLIPEAEALEVNASNPAKTLRDTEGKPLKKVFVVHGHDDAAKINVARFLERLALEPVILHEHANEGRTLIEKFEANSANVGYAIIILSPDDVGGAAAANEKAIKARARQNVIFEWGYFVGKLGRNRVAALHFAGVELPSDNSGVVYVPYEKGDTWMFAIAKELNKAGYTVDANRLL